MPEQARHYRDIAPRVAGLQHELTEGSRVDGPGPTPPMSTEAVPSGAAIPRDPDIVLLGLHINASADLRRWAKLGYKVLALTNDGHAGGLGSRHGHKLICPDPTKEFQAWADFMVRIGKHCLGKPVLIATEERFVLALDKAAARLETLFRFMGYGSGLKTALTSKRTTFDLAEQHDFPRPLTRFVASQEELEAVLPLFKERQCAVLIKPEFSIAWHTPEARRELRGRKVLSAERVEDLVEQYQSVERHSPNVMVQEIIPGPDRNLIYWAGFVGPDGRVHGRLTGRKVRILPIHYGVATLVELVDMVENEELCERFITKLGYRGRCGIEVKIDERDGQPKLIEVNPRTGIWEELGIHAGVDLAHEEVLALSGKATSPHRPSRFGGRWLHLGRDLRAFAAYRAEGSMGFMSWLWSLRPPILVTDLPWITDASYAWSNLLKMSRAGLRRS